MFIHFPHLSKVFRGHKSTIKECGRFSHYKNAITEHFITDSNKKHTEFTGIYNIFINYNPTLNFIIDDETPPQNWDIKKPETFCVSAFKKELNRISGNKDTKQSKSNDETPLGHFFHFLWFFIVLFYVFKRTRIIFREAKQIKNKNGNRYILLKLEAFWTEGCFALLFGNRASI